MLESLRAAQSTWIGKAVMGLIFLLIIVGLSFFGFADLFRNATASWVASVGGTEISQETYRQAYQNDLQQLQQRLRRSVTIAQAKQFGLEQQVLGRLVSDTVLDHQTQQMGLAISDPQIARLITEDPAFVGANGQFDHERFTGFLRNRGITEAGFVRDQRQVYLRQELENGIAGGLTAPKAAAEALHRFSAEIRSVDMIPVATSLIGEVAAPEAAVLQKFYDERKQQFAAPEYRKVTLLAVNPATVAKPDAVTDEDLRKAYDTAPETRFGSPELRTIQQIVFPSQSEADGAALRIAAGTTFAGIAAERNVMGKDLDLGTVSKAQIFDKPVADAAFSLPDGGTSGPVQGTFGTVLVHVAGITPGSRKPFDEVAPLIRRELAESPARTRDALRDIRDKIEDQRASGKTLAEAAKTAGLEVRVIDAVDVAGDDKAGTALAIPDQDQLLRAAFASDIGVDNDVIQTRAGDQIWFEVANIEPARQREIAEVKPQVLESWRKDESARLMAAKADDLAKMLQSGTAVEQVAIVAGNAAIRHVADLRRTGAEGVSQSVAAKIFDVGVGTAGTAVGEDGTRFVFKVLDSVTPPLDADAPETKQFDTQYRSALADAILTAYLTEVQAKLGVRVNPEALRGAVGGSS